MRDLTIRTLDCILYFALLSAPANSPAQTAPLPAGVERICAIQFDRDVKRPARVEDSALPCLEAAVKRMRADASVYCADPFAE